MKWNIDQIPSQEGRIAIVTGANSGLGYYTTRGLAGRGAEVVMACRSLAKADEAKEMILKDLPDARLRVMELDLGSLSSIKQFVENFKKEYSQLDLLINNAGLMAIPRRTTADGFEMQLGVNHLGHFALTGQLFSLLRITRGSRVVSVASMAHAIGKMDFEDLNWQKKYNKWAAYGRSKLANILFTLELAERVSGKETDMLAVVAHPGYASSNLIEKGPMMRGRAWMAKLGQVANKLVAQSTYMGALPTLYAATSPDVVPGGYYGPGGFAGMRGYPVRVYPRNKHTGRENRVKLWKVSEQLTGVRFLTES